MISEEPDASDYKARYLVKKELHNRIIAQTQYRLTSTMRIISGGRKFWAMMPVGRMGSRMCLMLTGTVKIGDRLVHDTIDRHKCNCGNDASSTLWLEHWLDECGWRGPAERQQIGAILSKADNARYGSSSTMKILKIMTRLALSSCSDNDR